MGGTLASTLYRLYDVNSGAEAEGADDDAAPKSAPVNFFMFPDISVRDTGRFRLRFDLYRVHSSGPHWLCSCTSADFQVYSTRTFQRLGGLDVSTALSVRLNQQGVKMQLRKNGHNGGSAGGAEGDDDEEGDGHAAKRPRIANADSGSFCDPA